MVALCTSLAKDRHDDPLMRRGRRSAAAAVEQAAGCGTEQYGGQFIVAVKPAPEPTNDSQAKPD